MGTSLNLAITHKSDRRLSHISRALNAENA